MKTPPEARPFFSYDHVFVVLLLQAVCSSNECCWSLVGIESSDSPSVSGGPGRWICWLTRAMTFHSHWAVNSCVRSDVRFRVGTRTFTSKPQTMVLSQERVEIPLPVGDEILPQKTVGWVCPKGGSEPPGRCPGDAPGRTQDTLTGPWNAPAFPGRTRRSAGERKVQASLFRPPPPPPPSSPHQRGREWTDGVTT